MDHSSSSRGTSPELRGGAPLSSSRARSAPHDSLLDSRLIEQTLGRVEHLARWMGWRLRILVVAALVGCLGVLLLARWMSGTPQIPAEWVTTPTGQLQLAGSADPRLQPHVGKVLAGVGSPRQRSVVPDVLAVKPSARGIND